jgi:hypothetical protein
VNRRGVLYDVGRVLYGNWRPDYRPDVVRRELQIIADDLHCTAVKICGRSLTRLTYASEVALDLGLEVWFAPELWGRSPPAPSPATCSRRAGPPAYCAVTNASTSAATTRRGDLATTVKNTFRS